MGNKTLLENQCHKEYGCLCGGLSKYCKFAEPKPFQPRICSFWIPNKDTMIDKCTNKVANFEADKEQDFE